MRFAGSLFLAAIVVMAIFAIGMHAWGVFDEEVRTLEFEEIRLISARERRDLAWLLGEDERTVPPRPSIEQIPRVPLPPREISGFVQLEVTVAPDGTVDNVDVLGAVPAGIYEEQAQEIVSERRYPPTIGGAPGTHTEIIEFTVPAEE